MEQRRSEAVISPFGVGGSIDQFPELSPIHRTGTHRAGFHSHIKAAGVQIFPSKCFCCSSYCNHFSVCGRVFQALRHIVSPSDYPAVAYDHRPNRNLVFCSGVCGFLEGLSHIFLICVHTYAGLCFRSICKRSEVSGLCVSGSMPSRVSF